MKKLVCMIALICAVAVQADAQDLKSILSGIAKNVVGDKATSEMSIIGTWVYVGPDCQLKGDDILKNFGGDAAGEEVEKKNDTKILLSLQLKPNQKSIELSSQLIDGRSRGIQFSGNTGNGFYNRKHFVCFKQKTHVFSQRYYISRNLYT